LAIDTLQIFAALVRRPSPMAGANRLFKNGVTNV
jgi:hypothetical protein